MTFTLTMDQAGRIIIPKPVRDRHGFADGTKFELADAGDSLQLTPVDVPARLEELSNGWLVFHGDLPPHFDIVAEVEQGRQERDERVAGSGPAARSASKRPSV